MGSATDLISIVDADPDLAELLDESQRERARREALTRVRRLSPGDWDVTRAIEPDVVNALRPPGVAATPMVAIAAITARAAAITRQNVSLRRILRRSTITSESSDIENSPKRRSAGGRPVLSEQR